jgi:hypothetical protein
MQKYLWKLSLFCIKPYAKVHHLQTLFILFRNITSTTYYTRYISSFLGTNIVFTCHLSFCFPPSKYKPTFPNVLIPGSVVDCLWQAISSVCTFETRNVDILIRQPSYSVPGKLHSLVLNPKIRQI